MTIDALDKLTDVEREEIKRRQEIAKKYTPAERAFIELHGAPCLTCQCDDNARSVCEAW